MIALTAALLAGAAVLIWRLLLPPDGFLTGLVPVDAERAVLVMRANYDNDPSRYWVVAVHADEGVLWSRELPGQTQSTWPRNGLTVTAGAIVVRVYDNDKRKSWLVGYALDDGQPLWTGEGDAYDASWTYTFPPDVPGGEPQGLEDRTYRWSSDGETTSLTAWLAAKGQRLWTHTLDGKFVRAQHVTHKYVVYRSDAGWTFLHAKNGHLAAELDAYAAACVHDGRFTAWSRETIYSIDLEADRIEVQRHPAPGGIEPLTTHCGVHDGNLVFVTRQGANPTKPDVRLVALTKPLDGVAWEIPMGVWGPKEIASLRDSDGADVHPLRGQLSDFVPLILGAHDQPFKLVMLDLKQHRIAWESRLADDLLHFGVFRGSDDQHFLVSSSVVGALDGRTGKLTAARGGAYMEIKGGYGSGGRLWLHTMDWRGMNALPWGALDGRTLKPGGTGNDEVTFGEDMLAKLIETLKLPPEAH